MLIVREPNGRASRKKTVKRVFKVGAFTYALLIKHMFDGTLTSRELADVTGLHYVTVLSYTRELHKAKAAHICMWEKDGYGRDSIKVYKLGEGTDAERFRMTSAQKSARHRVKKRGLEMIHRMAA
tara:strand:- start:1671 stop:2045 length:375 start_codon:yes stop_codon:yes gene_type:complete